MTPFPDLRVLATIVALPASALPLAAQSPGLNPTPGETNAFLAADANRDVVLQFAEFKVFIRLMAEAGQPTARQVRRFAAYRFAFNIADKNNDRVVSPDELRAADDAHQAGESQ